MHVGSSSLRVRKDTDSPWKTLVTWPFGESGGPVTFSKDGKSLIITSSLDSNMLQGRMQPWTGVPGSTAKVGGNDQKPN